MSRNTAVLTAMLMFLLIASTATAGRPHERDGFVIGFNLGLGSARVHPDNQVDSDADNSSGGGGGAFRLGWAFANQFMVGLEGAAWVNSESEGDVTLTSSLINFTWYPAASGFFLRTGLGGGKVEVTFDLGGQDVTLSDTGGSFGLGGGYEWRLGGKFALGAALDYHTFSVDGGDFDFFNGTVQLNWYF